MDYIVNDTALTATADAIREKTESTDKITWSGEKGFADAISEISGGAEVYQTPYGTWYTPHMVLTSPSAPKSALVNNMYREATELISFECDFSGLCGAQFAFSNCTKLKTVELPKCTGFWLGNTHTFGDNSALESVVIGSIGVPVTRMDAGGFSVPSTMVLTLYVNAETYADIPTLVTDNLSAQWNKCTIVFRNSTTGEIIPIETEETEE